jgi:CheY-like chemotaxis protein
MAQILVVDDNAHFRDTAAAYLREEGYDAAVATNGVSGLKLAYANRPDLVIADILMPGMSGLELCRLLKDASDTHDIPVILITGVAELEPAEEAAAGANAVLRKPIDMNDLVACIRSLLPAQN